MAAPRKYPPKLRERAIRPHVLRPSSLRTRDLLLVVEDDHGCPRGWQSGTFDGAYPGSEPESEKPRND